MFCVNPFIITQLCEQSYPGCGPQEQRLRENAPRLPLQLPAAMNSTTRGLLIECNFHVQIEMVAKKLLVGNVRLDVPVHIYSPQPPPTEFFAEPPPYWSPQVFGVTDINIPPPAYSSLPPPPGVLVDQPMPTAPPAYGGAGYQGGGYQGGGYPGGGYQGGGYQSGGYQSGAGAAYPPVCYGLQRPCLWLIPSPGPSAHFVSPSPSTQQSAPSAGYPPADGQYPPSDSAYSSQYPPPSSGYQSGGYQGAFPGSYDKDVKPSAPPETDDINEPLLKH